MNSLASAKGKQTRLAFYQSHDQLKSVCFECASVQLNSIRCNSRFFFFFFFFSFRFYYYCYYYCFSNFHLLWSSRLASSVLDCGQSRAEFVTLSASDLPSIAMRSAQLRLAFLRRSFAYQAAIETINLAVCLRCVF